MQLRLLESHRRRQRTTREALASVTIHAALIAAFVYATAQSTEISLAPAQSFQPITFAVPRAAPAAPAPAPAPKPRPVARARADNTAPTTPVVEEPVSTVGAGEGSAAGVGDSPGERGAYYDYEVGVSAAALGGGMRPRYPDALQRTGVEGRVEVEFVVDERGRVDMKSVRVIDSTHELFTRAVRNALGGMRFSPARINGVAVRQFVRLPVVFQIRG